MPDYSRLFSIGQGQAQVFSSAPVIQQYANQLALAEQNRAKEREKWAKELESVDFKGARPQDHQHLMDQWEKVLEKNYAREVSTDKKERLRLSSEMQLLKKQMMSEANRSVQEYAIDKQILALPLSKDEDQLPTNYNEMIAARNKTSTFSPTFQDFGTEKFILTPKPFDPNNAIDDIARYSAKAVNTETTFGTGLDTKRAVLKGQELSEESFKTGLLHLISTNRAAKRSFMNGLEPTESNLEDVVEAAWEVARGKYKPDLVIGDYVNPSGRELSLYKQKRVIGEAFKDEDKSEIGYEESVMIPFGRRSDASVVKAQNVAKISPSRVNIVGVEAINLINGKIIRVPNMESAAAISILGDFPIISKGLKLSGRLAQPKFVEKNSDKVAYKRGAIVTFRNADNEETTVLVPVEALPNTNEVINRALRSMPQEVYKHPKATSPNNQYKEVRTLKDSSGKTYEAEVKDGVWHDIKTGKKL